MRPEVRGIFNDVVLVLCAVAVCSAIPASARAEGRLGRKAPNIVWPESYTISYEYSLPYVKEYQKGGLSVPCTTYLKKDKLRLDTYGTESTLITTKETDIEIVPRLNQTRCLIFVNGDESKHGVGSLIHGATPVLPDISKWPYLGTTDLNGESVHLFRFEEKHGEKVARYSFYIRQDKSPLRLHQHGPDLMSGSHFDEWIVDFTNYIPHEVEDSMFEAPELCEGVTPGNRSAEAASSFPLRMRRLLPGASAPHQAPGERSLAYDAFAAQHGRKHASAEDYQRRLSTFHSNLEFIERHNAREDKTHTLAVNHFTDWTEEEFLQVMLPNHGKQLARPLRGPELQHHSVTPKYRIPAVVDWSHTGADGVVKDQSACGSCWAFGAVGAAQAAWYMATGESKLLSEQQLMDCSWGRTHNKACDGGLAEGAYAYLMAGKGTPLALLDDYPYRGQDSFCRDNATAVQEHGVRLKGFRTVKKGDTDGVREALYTRGPLTVSIDAGNPSFRFYSSGVYDEPACKWKQNDLDHSVMLVGYGSTREGKDYWTIKNSWSKYWGDKGYIKISRDHHGCGITTDAIYAEVDVGDRDAATAEQ